MKEATNSYKSLNTLLMYLGVNKKDYWHIDYEINYDLEDIRKYYLDITKKATWYEGEFDSNGIYLYKGSDGENYYSVINLAQYAIGSYLEYIKTSDLKWKEEFIRHCDWLVDNQERYKETDGVWVNHYPMKTFALEGKWVSALAQAFGISALCRAYLETKEKKYLEAAVKATDSYFAHVSKGGVLCEMPNESLILEEYTTSTKSCVLNGYIFAVWSLNDLNNIVKEERLIELYNKCILSIEKNIDRWDVGYWSRYDLYEKHFNISSYFYHSLHIKQLKVLYNMTGVEKFKVYYEKWEKNRKSKFCRIKSLFNKVLFRLRK